MAEDIAVVCTYRRDAMLFLALEALRADDPDIPVLVSSDRGHDTRDLRDTCRQFNVSHLEIRPDSNRYGNTFNVIMGMSQALSMGGDGLRFVHSIEDDTIVNRGFFNWSRNALSSGHFTVALARIPGDPPSTWYESPCVSWNADRLREAIAMAPAGYLTAATRLDMQRIADGAFSKSRYKFGSAEQDGYFLRVMELKGWKTAFPPHSYASHIGYFGYNQPPGRTESHGNFEERIAFNRALLKDKELRTAWFGQHITEREMRGMTFTE